jgi:hypothetical protein
MRDPSLTRYGKMNDPREAMFRRELEVILLELLNYANSLSSGQNVPMSHTLKRGSYSIPLGITSYV